MIVVSDTSVLYYAARLGFSAFFPKLFGEVIVPPAVHRELADASDDFINTLLSETWLKIAVPQDSDFVRSLMKTLDEGESEAIALAIELQADIILIDEALGRKQAKDFSLKVTGLLGLFVRAKYAGLTPAVKPWIERLLAQTGFRHSEALIQEILSQANENQ